MTTPTPRPALLSLAPYVGGEAVATGGTRLIRLASNEGAYGCPPAAVAALQSAAAEAHRYPDGHCQALRAALAAHYNTHVEKIVCGAGSDELISLLIRAYAGEGDEVLFSQHGFLMYGISALTAGATPVKAPEGSDLKANIAALHAAITPRTKLVFIANPNNPTGSMLTREEIAALHQGLPPHVLLVLDAAYCEFVDDPLYSAGDEWVDLGNVVVLRTFSKIYALAAVRLGWAHCAPAIADALNRVRNPFNVSAMAQAAGIAALESHAFVAETKEKNAHVKQQFMTDLHQLGLYAYPSPANFVLVKFGTRAEEIRLALKERGILVRQMGAYHLPEHLRITIGTAEEMSIVAHVLREILDHA